MSHDNEVEDLIRGRQRLLRTALDNHHIALKSVSAASKIPYSTLLSYFPVSDNKPTALIPFSAVVRLFKAIPNDLLSILTEPEGRCFATVDDDDDLTELMTAHENLSAAIIKRGGKVK